MAGSNKTLHVVLSILIFIVVALFGGAYAEYSFSSDPDAVEAAADSVFLLEVYDDNGNKTAVGSGFVIFEQDILATNYHVIADGAYVMAISDESVPYYVDQLCIANQEHDIALLRFSKAESFTPLVADTSNELKRSSTVVAIGSPAGLKNTVSIGNISAIYDQNGKNWIQFTAPISSGSSGGVLLNDRGYVIGITTATYASTQNVNLAVRIEKLVQLYQSWNRKTRFMGRVSHEAELTADIQTIPVDSAVTVWVTNSGKKYHNNPNCSKMKKPIEIDLLEAIQNGYEPCNRCYK